MKSRYKLAIATCVVLILASLIGIIAACVQEEVSVITVTALSVAALAGLYTAYQLKQLSQT